MKDLVYCITYIVPIIIISIGLYKENINVVENGFSLLVFIYFAYIGSCIRSIKNNIVMDKRRLLIAVILFVFAILILIYFAVIEKVIIGSLCCAVLGCIAFYYLRKT